MNNVTIVVRASCEVHCAYISRMSRLIKKVTVRQVTWTPMRTLSNVGDNVEEHTDTSIVGEL